MKIQDCLRNKSATLCRRADAPPGDDPRSPRTRGPRSDCEVLLWSIAGRAGGGPSPWLSLGPLDPKTWPSPRPSLSTRLSGSLTHRPGCQSQLRPKNAPWAFGARGPPHGLPRPAGERRAHLSSLAKCSPHLSENHSGRQGKGGTSMPHLLLLLSVFLASFF